MREDGSILMTADGDRRRPFLGIFSEDDAGAHGVTRMEARITTRTFLPSALC